MPTAEQSAQEILSLFVASGARPGRSFPTVTAGAPFQVAAFAGALQQQFIQAGYQVSDLVAGLAYAVTEGWLSLGQSYTDAAGNVSQSYVLEQSGWTEASGTAPTQAASAQQLINVAAAINDTPNAVRFRLENLNTVFVGTVAENTFAIEDMIGAYGLAFFNGWIRPCGNSLFDPVFTLTAAGAAQAT